MRGWKYMYSGLQIVGLLVIFVAGPGWCAAEEASVPHKSESSDVNKLIQLQVIFRHGERTPEHTFPTDPNKKALKNLGFGQLTNKGKEQMYELGRYLRQRYADFLNDRYVPAEVVATSSDSDRTIASALCVLAGCYPPTVTSQQWKSDLLWQPIPVKMVPKSMDHKLYVGFQNCDRKREIHQNDYRPLLDKYYKDDYKYLTDLAKFNVTGSEDVRTISESYEYAKKTNITLPVWMLELEDKTQMLYEITYNGWIIMMADKYLKYLGVGSLVGEIVFNMQNRTDNGDQHRKQISLYSTHDTVLYGFLSILGVFNDLRPYFASAIIIEQRQRQDGTEFVQMLYRNDSSKDPVVLRFPNCQSTPCLLDDFYNITKSLIPKNIELECRLPVVNEPASTSAYSSSKGLSITQSLWIIFGVVAALAVLIIVVGVFVVRNTEFRSRVGYSKL